jgi:hypothetical protein
LEDVRAELAEARENLPKHEQTAQEASKVVVDTLMIH